MMGTSLVVRTLYLANQIEYANTSRLSIGEGGHLADDSYSEHLKITQ